MGFLNLIEVIFLYPPRDPASEPRNSGSGMYVGGKKMVNCRKTLGSQLAWKLLHSIFAVQHTSWNLRYPPKTNPMVNSPFFNKAGYLLGTLDCHEH